MSRLNGQAEMTEVVVTMKHQTERAVLINDGTVDHWLPKSQVYPEDSGGVFPEKGITFTLMVPEWLAKKLGLYNATAQSQTLQDATSAIIGAYLAAHQTTVVRAPHAAVQRRTIRGVEDILTI